MLLPAAALLLAARAFASPVDLAEDEAPLEKRSCPNIHVFGARETTAPVGYGSAGTVVDLILAAHSGATSEAISYPACGGQSTCGDVSYASSVIQGVAAVASQVNTFNSECPSTILVLVGYSQVSSSLIKLITSEMNTEKTDRCIGWSNHG
jgi:acetylxylan esterase